MPEVGSRVQISSAPKAWSCGRENAIDAERRSRSAVGAIAASDIAVHRAAWRVVATAYGRRVVDIERRPKAEMIIAITSELGALVSAQLEREAWAIIVPKI
jgi:hypothetical protein